VAGATAAEAGGETVVTSNVQRPDPDVVLQGLKDFQRNTVEYVFSQLYGDKNGGTGRFLIADEVGLGKTLVARGLIARAVDHLWEDVERIDIIYICSNADIARQNINRLSIPGLHHFTPASRITLLPRVRKDGSKGGLSFKDARINFIPLTPRTSLDLKSSYGKAQERALLYRMLQEHYALPVDGALHLFHGTASYENFRDYHLPGFNRDYDIDAGLHEMFLAALEKKPALVQELKETCAELDRAAPGTCDQLHRRRIRLVSRLRRLLAETCVEALQPDIIILDEFQRFKELLDGTSPAGELAKEMFHFENEEASVRTLLLSATPYKMYTLSHEAEVDDHYQDFLSTLKFLFRSPERLEQFKGLLASYRRELLNLATDPDHATQQLLQAKSAIEASLRQVVVRTEKLTASADRNGMLQSKSNGWPELKADDLLAYVSLEQLARQLHHYNTLEYWKSAPYLLNFMERDHYKLKSEYEAALINAESRDDLVRLLADAPHLLLERNAIDHYQAVDEGNARLRVLMKDMVEPGYWKLLWLPPSLPYYRLQGPFAKAKAQNVSKRLVFSSWHVVPKAASILLSYEVERRIVRQLEEEPKNTSEARSARGNRLRFDAQASGMPVLALLYPSMTLAEHCDPLRICAEAGEVLSLSELHQKLQTRIEELLERAGIRLSDRNIDKNWEWFAPIFLDLQFRPEATIEWWQHPELVSRWRGEDDGGAGDSSWAERVQEIRELLQSDHPERAFQNASLYLPYILADMALAGPAVTALRALGRITGGADTYSNLDIRFSAGNVAWAMRNLFNIPEASALVRGLYTSKLSYWRQILMYGADGGLQAVLDEYAHILKESLGLLDESAEVVAAKVAEAMRQAMQIRTSALKVDDIRPAATQDEILEDEFRSRTHFALRFGDIHSETEGRLARKEQVRDAFNSPFWPFILLTTSVGQEGLDFHQYCHAVVHWNLPSNPVDLEQREGRVHRYKGHAVRKNLAHILGARVLLSDRVADPWQALFEEASHQKSKETLDLVPFWIYPETEEEAATAVAHIERHVPAFALSKDERRLDSLRRSLTVYRMVFGQNRQEDLVDYLLTQLPNERRDKLLRELQIDLEPPQHNNQSMLDLEP
jgi:hypothetical protein